MQLGTVPVGVYLADFHITIWMDLKLEPSALTILFPKEKAVNMM